MRARYSAYVVGDEAFLLRSWHDSTRPESIGFDPTVAWIELEVGDVDRGGPLDRDGTVEFRARFIRDGERFELHETSTFVRDGDHWVYVDGR